MDALRTHFEALGFGTVTTFIASGNVIFDASGRASAMEARIERSLRRALGYDVATFLEYACVRKTPSGPFTSLSKLIGSWAAAGLPQA